MAKINVTQFDTRSAARSRTLSIHQPIPNSGQVLNSTGGHVWEVNDWDRLNRFLILGAEGGTYYIREPDLLKTNHEAVLRCLKADGPRTVKAIVDVSVGGRAYKNDPAILALALAVTHGDPDTKALAFAAVTSVCRTGTHLYHFIDYASKMRGLGRGLRNAVARWFNSRKADQLAYQIVKYQQRDGWSARDCLRVAHPNDADPGRQAVYRWIVGGLKALDARTINRKRGTKVEKVEYPSVRESLPVLIEAFEKAKTADEKTLVKLIVEHRLPREAVPTDKLNSLPVWEALLQHMPLTAMIRNLGKMTSIGLVKPLSANGKLIVNQLGDEKALRKARVHPMQVLLAAKTYAMGHGIKGDLRWSPVPSILTALDKAFYATFPNVIPAGKPLLIALDVSGSMGSPIMGTPISSCEAVAALSLVHCNVEPEVHVFGFASTFRDLRIRKGMTLEQACRCASDNNFGSTNVSLAYEYALKHKLEVGGFIVMTDSETNGGAHPALRLREYRDRYTPDARSVVVATTATSFTVNDPTDKYGLDVAGFDASVPRLIADFIRDDLGKAAASAEDEPAAE